MTAIKSGFTELISYKNQIIYGLATTLITVGLFFDVRFNRYDQYDRTKMFFYSYIVIAAYFSYQLYLAFEKKNANSSFGWFLIKFAEALYLFIDMVNIYTSTSHYDREFGPSFSIVMVIILIQMVVMFFKQKNLVNTYDDNNILSHTPEITMQK